MGLFSVFTSAFADGRHSNQQDTPSSVSPSREGIPLLDTSSRDFENRLFRARTEPLHFLRQRFMDGHCISADIHNDESGGTYRVTAQSCECEDFAKHGHPAILLRMCQVLIGKNLTDGRTGNEEEKSVVYGMKS